MKETEQQPTAERKVAVNWPNLETREQKLARKQRARDMFYRSHSGSSFIMANLSVNHQDYGMSPAEHLSAKSERLL